MSMPEEMMGAIDRRAAGGAAGAAEEAPTPTPEAAGAAMPAAGAGDPTLNAILTMVKLAEAIKNGETRLTNKAKMALSKVSDLLHAVEAELSPTQEKGKKVEAAPAPPLPPPAPAAGEGAGIRDQMAAGATASPTI